jgi:methanethiol S-methyltransferase
MATCTDYGILTGCWILFCVIHHITAMEKCKKMFQSKMGRRFQYYRLIYSFLALATLIFVLWFQFSINSVGLGIPVRIEYFIGLPFGILGTFLMGVSISKYFIKLSGIGVFYPEKRPASLELYGVHKYIRHPLYLGTLLSMWSLFLFFPLLSNFLSCLSITLYVLIGIRSEEKKLLIQFGEVYANYKRSTPKLIPNFLFISKAILNYS